MAADKEGIGDVDGHHFDGAGVTGAHAGGRVVADVAQAVQSVQPLRRSCYNGFTDTSMEMTMMNDVQERQPNGLTAEIHRPLIVVPIGDNEVRYFTSKEEANRARNREDIQKALDLAGAWSHLDGDEMIEALNRIRHESKPTSPLASID